MSALTTHLQSRFVNFDLHRPIIDDDAGVATFLLFNLSRQIVGTQQYRPHAPKTARNDPREGRYFTRSKSGTIAVFGIESLHLNPNIVFVTEGIFDAVRLTSIGIPAIAVLSNNPTPDLKNFLQCLGRKVIVVCDADSAGRALAKFGDVSETLGEKDLGEAEQSTVDALVAKFV